MIAVATFGLVLATSVVGIVTLMGIREQLWLMTFAEYTRRYSDIMKGIPFEARRPGGQFDLASLSPDGRESFLGAMRSYLNLSSEELYLYRRGRIDRETWRIWEIGIRDTLQCSGFQAAWLALRDEYGFYGDFQAFIDDTTAIHTSRQ